MKSIKLFKYANEYVKRLNVFYDVHQNVIDECVLNEEYGLMIDILDDLVYNNRDS